MPPSPFSVAATTCPQQRSPVSPTMDSSESTPREVILRGSIQQEIMLQAQSITTGVFQHITFLNCILRQVELKNCKLDNCYLEKSTLDSSKLYKCGIKDSKVDKCELEKTVQDTVAVASAPNFYLSLERRLGGSFYRNCNFEQCSIAQATVLQSKFYGGELRLVFAENTEIKQTAILGCNLLQCTIEEGTISESRTREVNCLNIACSEITIESCPLAFHKFPLEITRLIFREALSWKGKIPALLAALRGNKALYSEGLEILHSTGKFTISNKNWDMKDGMSCSSTMDLSTVRNLHVSMDFDFNMLRQVLRKVADSQFINLQTVAILADERPLRKYFVKLFIDESLPKLRDIPSLQRLSFHYQEYEAPLFQRGQGGIASPLPARLVNCLNDDLGTQAIVKEDKINHRYTYIWEGAPGFLKGRGDSDTDSDTDLVPPRRPTGLRPALRSTQLIRYLNLDQ